MKLLYTNRARKDIKKLDVQMKLRIKAAVELLPDGDIKPIQGYRNLYRLRRDYNVEVIANYCYDIEPSVDIYSRGDRFAAFQIGDILGLSEPVIRSLPSVYG